MSYPKPLSEKTLEKMYINAYINEKKSKFLHAFFEAAANLYGAITMKDLWQIYRELSKTENWPSIKRKDILAFSEITRREPNQPYYVYEIDELYSEEPRTEIYRFLIRKDVICGSGMYAFAAFWKLIELQSDKPFYMPASFLSYAKMQITPEEEALISFVGSLKVTAKTSIVYNHEYKCIHYGEYLKDFEGRLSDEQFMIDYYSGKIENGPKENTRKIAELEKEYSGIFSERLVKDLMWRSSTGWTNSNTAIKFLTDALYEIGVRLTKKQLEKLLELVMNAHNNSHLMCNCGWTPTELAANTYIPGTIPQLSLGPGIQKAFDNGDLDKDEFVKRLKEMGIDVL